MAQSDQSKWIRSSTLAGDTGAEAKNLLNISVNLKQWRVLHAVVTCGSFANAAELLNVSQPAISYAIGKMEAQLGVRLLKLEGRKAQLTEHGDALLERARFLLREAADIEEYAASIRRGFGPQIRLAVDHNFPTYMVVPALRLFSTQGRTVRVVLTETSSAEIEKVLHSRSVDLAISELVPAGFPSELLTETEYLPVAYPEHPLFGLRRELRQSDLDQEVRVVLSSDSPKDCGQKNQGHSEKLRWVVSNFDTAESALMAGVGYGWMPRHRIEKALQSGQIKVLPLRNVAAQKSSFHVVFARMSAQSSDAHRLAEVLYRTVPSSAAVKKIKPENDAGAMVTKLASSESALCHRP